VSPEPPRQAVTIHTAITEQPLDVADAYARVADPACGGVTVFTGVVRDHHDGAAVTGLTYEAWPDRAEDELAAVAAEVAASHPSVRALVAVHRLGALAVGDVSVVVAASAPHRDASFAAARALIDLLKQRVPIWKHEHLADGSSRWPGSDC
jgi:molybdopterin synthase catalytic subunit